MTGGTRGPGANGPPGGPAQIGMVRWPTGVLEEGLSPIKIAQALGEKGAIGWLNLEAPGADDRHALESLFGFHPLALEDALNANTRPKATRPSDCGSTPRCSAWPGCWLTARIATKRKFSGTPRIRLVTTFRKGYDHVLRILDPRETDRDLFQGLLDRHLSQVNNRMSAVVKRLTLLTAIGLRMTIVSGFFGMTFEVMPSIKSSWGMATTGLMAGTSVGIDGFFQWRRWR